MLVVSAAPRQDTQHTKSQDLHFDADREEVDADINLEEVLEADPSILHQIDPDLVRGAGWVELEVDRHVVLEVLRRHKEEEEAEVEAEEANKGDDNDANSSHHRRKRQTVLTGDVNVDKQRG